MKRLTAFIFLFCSLSLSATVYAQTNSGNHQIIGKAESEGTAWVTSPESNMLFHPSGFNFVSK